MEDRFKFKIFDVDDNILRAVDSLHFRKNGSCHVVAENITLEVNEEQPLLQSVGIKSDEGNLIYDGDIFTVDDYPFFNKGFHHYVGIICYEPGLDYLGWYYEVYTVSERVRGAALGHSLTNLAGQPIKIIGNKYTHPELLEVKS